MHAPRLTPVARDTELAVLRAQHVHDLLVLELAADIIVCQDERIAVLEADQASLIVAAHRDRKLH